jgi:hypothetical protein
MSVTVAVCVRPPVAGTPLPNVPVNIRVYVPLGVVLPLVLIVAVLLAEVDPVNDKKFGEIVQVEPGGNPLQSATVPVKPPRGAKVIFWVVFCPRLIVCEAGVAKIEKSITFCLSPAEALPLKLLSPIKVAVSVSVPDVENEIKQPPIKKTVHESPAPSLTLTLPLGTPLPGGMAALAKFTVTGWPTTDGLGVFVMMVVVVLALFTICITPTETLRPKLLSPE